MCNWSWLHRTSNSSASCKQRFSVVGVDVNEEVVSTINKGKIHIVEADLGAFVKSAISTGQLKAFNKYSQVMFI